MQDCSRVQSDKSGVTSAEKVRISGLLGISDFGFRISMATLPRVVERKQHRQAGKAIQSTY